MNFCSQLPELCHYVCVLASSSSIQLCLCANDYPTLLNMRKENFCHSTMPWECLDLRIQSSMVILLSTCHLRRLVFFPQPLFVLKHVEALRYSLYRYSCPGYFELSIMSLFPAVLLTTFWKINKKIRPFSSMHLHSMCIWEPWVN
jgi:hypothetical protein